MYSIMEMNYATQFQLPTKMSTGFQPSNEKLLSCYMTPSYKIKTIVTIITLYGFITIINHAHKSFSSLSTQELSTNTVLPNINYDYCVNC